MFGFFKRLRRIEAKLDRALALLGQQGEATMTTQEAIADLTAQVAQNTSVEQSAAALIEGLAQKLIDALSAGGDSAQQVVQIEQIAQQLKASSAALSAAITANTPAAPPAPETPAADAGSSSPG